MQFTKLFSSILDSTIWQEPAETRLVWITMLAMVDRRGEVHASIPGLAKRAGVTLAQCEQALECLLSPDKYSRTPDHEGRRIQEIDGGWELLNHAKYRALLSSEERREYNRKKQAEYRAKKKQEASKNVNDMSIAVNHSEQNAHITEAEAETDSKRKKTMEPSEEGFQFADWFQTLRPATMKATKAELKKWAKEYDDIQRLDGKTKDQIKAVCKWARNDNFWKTNFFSPNKLRKKNGDGIKYFDVFQANLRQQSKSHEPRPV